MSDAFGSIPFDPAALEGPSPQALAKVEEGIAAFGLPERAQPQAPKESKWLLASCLQKAIRQGDADAAVSAMDGLCVADRAYGLHRMAVICMEDVGLANVPLMAAFLATGIRKAWFDSRGGRAPALWFAREMALSRKDRAACDLPLLAERLPEESRANAFSKGVEELADVLAKPAVDLRFRALAAWAILGTEKIRSDALPERPQDVASFLGACAGLGVDPLVLWCAREGIAIQREWHPVALPLLAAELAREPAVEGAPMPNGLLRTSGSRDGLFLPGLDGHTREGRRAMSRWLAQSSAPGSIRAFARRFAADSDKQAELAGNLLFAFEGGRCANLLPYKAASRVATGSAAATAARWGMGQEDWREAGAVMLAELPRLDAIRSELARDLGWPAGGAAPQVGQSAEAFLAKLGIKPGSP